jgi:hypothetical protein
MEKEVDQGLQRGSNQEIANNVGKGGKIFRVPMLR